MLEAVAAETVGMVVCVGLPVVVNAAVYDAAALLVNGQIVGLVAKRHLAGDGVHYEPRWFKPWPIGARTVIVRLMLRAGASDMEINDTVTSAT
jgi:NAD+ synthase (glutamine-hydrolysing)